MPWQIWLIGQYGLGQAAASQAPGVLDDALGAIRAGYDDVEVVPGSGKRVED